MRKLILLTLFLFLPACSSKPPAWTSSHALAAFKAAGLEVETPQVMEPKDYGLAPMRAKEGQRFQLPSLCDECGGRVFSFSTTADRDAMKSYYEELSKQSAAFFSWVFVKDNLLVQLNGELPKDKAEAYNAALEAVRP